MCIYSCMAHQIKDAHPRRQSDYVGPTCVQDVKHMYSMVFTIFKFYLFYEINGSGRKRIGEASCSVACKGSWMLKWL